MAVRDFHPILYVEDPYAERDFFALFGFQTEFEDDAAPGFLAVRCDGVLFGLSGNKPLPHRSSHDGIRWQLLVDDLRWVTAICDEAGLTYELVEEEVAQHHPHLVVVISPNGVPIWFEAVESGRQASGGAGDLVVPPRRPTSPDSRAAASSPDRRPDRR